MGRDGRGMPVRANGGAMSVQHMAGILEIAQRLRYLADDMTEVATLMDYYGGFAEWARHGVELAGAAHIARGWANAIEAEQTLTANAALIGAEGGLAD